MKMNPAIRCFGVICCIIAVVNAASVSVNKAKLFVKPGADVTLECTGSETSLSYYIKNSVEWYYVQLNGETIQITTGSFYMTDLSHDINIANEDKSTHIKYQLLYDQTTNGRFVFKLQVLGITHSDNGKYVCSLINENKATEDMKTVDLVVMHPVDKVQLELHNANHEVIKSSKAPVTQGDMPLHLSPGKYMVMCTATGSNPEPSITLALNEVAVNVAPTVTNAVKNGRQQYKGVVSVPQVMLSAKAMDQVISCEANIPGTNYDVSAASMLLKVEIDKPDVECGNFTRALGNKYQSIQCSITAPSGLTCDKVNWVLSDVNEVIHPGRDNKFKDQSGKYDIMEAACQGTESMLKTNLTFYELKEAHFSAVYYVQYGVGENAHRHSVSIYRDNSGTDDTSAAGVIVPLSLLATIVMAIVSKHLL